MSSIGNAASLRGGTLLMTPLRGMDGEVYGIAQGSMVVSGFGVKGNDGSKLSINVPSSGRVPNGATVEREVPNNFTAQPFVVLNLHTPDFTTAARTAEAINHLLGEGTAQAMDAVSVKVAAPQDPNQRIAYLSTLEAVEIEPGEAPARVIVNSPHRHGGHRVAGAGVAGGRGAWVAVRDHHRTTGREPARHAFPRARPWSRRAAKSPSTRTRRACSCSTPA